MRGILFKAKRIDNGEWVEGFVSRPFSRNAEGNITNYCFNALDEMGFVGGCIVSADTICQYTGLTDKNGRRIWENDIVKDNVVFGTVVWDERYVQFMIDDEFDGHQDYSDWWGEVEVIGNIFDNKDLMGE